jgi:uncharacterized protein (DUF1697 family)
MPVYIAMLRGINVSGHKPVKMDRLRASFEALGFGDVKTYVQSGNVVFKAGKISEAGLVKKIAQKNLGDFGHEVSVLVRTPEELGEVLKRNPLLKQAGVDEGRLYVTFLSGPAAESAAETLKPLAAKTSTLPSWAAKFICIVRKAMAIPSFPTRPSRKSLVWKPPPGTGARLMRFWRWAKLEMPSWRRLPSNRRRNFENGWRPTTRR